MTLMKNKLLTATAVAVGIGVGAVAFSAIGPVGAQTPSSSTSSTSSTSSSSSSTPAGSKAALAGRSRLRARFIKEAAGVAAGKIGVTVTDLRDAVRNGQSIAQVATAHNVNPADVKTAIVNDIDAKIDHAVQTGRLSADRAAKLKERVPTATDRLLNFTRGG
jgi:hypothetical protein